MQLLLERNLGDRQLADRLGNTALHIACANGHIDLASLLLKQGIANTESCNVVSNFYFICFFVKLWRLKAFFFRIVL